MVNGRVKESKQMAENVLGRIYKEHIPEPVYTKEADGGELLYKELKLSNFTDEMLS
ncbi:hypothetical protein IBTHAUMO2_690031 [Nitrosopumilaceae archaeon]|nr:hypothetical protein IBTHAUMO2_690031 [Nitrosopumilaceae archaeon]